MLVQLQDEMQMETEHKKKTNANSKETLAVILELL